MNKLEHHRSTKLWNGSLPLCPVYYNKQTGERDISLSNVCRATSGLTLGQESGFREIGIDPIEDHIPKKQSWLLKQTKQKVVKPDVMAKRLVTALRKFIVENWDSNVHHIMLHSGGFDSRMISYILADLRNERGEDWVGDLVMCCVKPEDDVFIPMMKKQGWKRDYYRVYGLEQPTLSNYDKNRIFDEDINAFAPPSSPIWRHLRKDLVTPGTEDGYVIITGSFGGEILEYPAQAIAGKRRAPNRRKLSHVRLRDLIFYARSQLLNLCKIYNDWGGVMMPFVSYEYLRQAFNAPIQHFKMVKTKKGESISLLRCLMLSQLGDTLPVSKRQAFKWSLSKSRKQFMRKAFSRSRFFADYSHLPFVKKAKPWVAPRKSLACKLYGYATMYENT